MEEDGLSSGMLQNASTMVLLLMPVMSGVMALSYGKCSVTGHSHTKVKNYLMGHTSFRKQNAVNYLYSIIFLYRKNRTEDFGVY